MYTDSDGLRCVSCGHYEWSEPVSGYNFTVSTHKKSVGVARKTNSTPCMAPTAEGTACRNRTVPPDSQRCRYHRDAIV